MNTYVDYPSLFRDVGIDILSLYLFSYKTLYRRSHNRELFVICSLVNIFMLLVIMALVRTAFSVAAGFGLFGLLSILTLRSEPFTKGEMAYMFGGIALAVINGPGIPDFVFVLTANTMIVLSAALMSSWLIVSSASIAVTLDRIDPDALNNHSVMKDKLRMMFNVDVSDFDLKRVDYVRDVMEIKVAYLVDPADRSGSANQGRPFPQTAGQLVHGALPLPTSTNDPP